MGFSAAWVPAFLVTLFFAFFFDIAGLLSCFWRSLAARLAAAPVTTGQVALVIEAVQRNLAGPVNASPPGLEAR
jgi:hypothetical protein